MSEHLLCTSFGRKTMNTLEKQVMTEQNGKFLHKLRYKIFCGYRFKQRESFVDSVKLD